MGKRKKRTHLLALLLACFVVWPTGLGMPTASADANVVDDQKLQTVTIKNDHLSMVLDYNKKSVIRSLKLDSTELLGASGLDSSAVLDVDNSTISSINLSQSPMIDVEANSVTVNFTVGNSKLLIDEQWNFQVTQSNISLKVSRDYHWLETANTKLRHNGMVEIGWQRVWDNIRRPDDGGNIPLGNKYAGKNGMYLNTTGETTGLEQGDFVLLNCDKSQALKINAVSDRKIATEFGFLNDQEMFMDTLLSNNPWNYTAGSKTDGMVIGGHSSTDGTYIYSPVDVEQGQHDSISYTFSAGNYSDYYETGLIKGVSDTAALSSMLNDLGRSAIIDKDYGFSTVGIYQTGHGAYDSPYYLPLMEGLFDQKAVESEKNQLIYDKDYAQESSGHLNGRTFHRDTKWSNDTLMDSDPAYAISISRVYQYSPDKQWLASIRESGEKALEYMIEKHLNSNGLFNTGVDNTSQDGLFREWNDIFYIGNESSYINVLMYDALVQWADLENNVLNNHSLGKKYEQLAAKLKLQFNKNYTDGGFWSPKYSTFVYWRDKNGSIHGDVIQAQIGMMAIQAGLTDLSRSKSIMNTIDTYMKKNNLKLIPENFIDYAKTDYPDYQGINAFKTGVENGAVYPLFVENYMAAAAKIGEREKSLTYLENTISRYKTDGFFGFSHLDWNLNIPSGFQEKWFPVNANAASGLYKWMLGIQPTRTGITIAPNLPTKMYGTCVSKTIRGNMNLIVKYLSETSIDIKWNASQLPVTVAWSGLVPGSTYAVKDNGVVCRRTADSNGGVKYTYSSGIQHQVSISKS